MKKLYTPIFYIQLFADQPPVNTTASEGLSPSMRTFYADLLRDGVEPNLVHDQFGQQKDIPANSGKTINFRRFDPLPKMTTPLTEGVTPDGQSLNQQDFTAELKQYGGWIGMTDMLLLTSTDVKIVEATELLQSQAARTLDTITREVLNGGTNVQYGADSTTARNLLDKDDKLIVDCIKRAVRKLKLQNAEKIDGKTYVAIIHPDCEYDLTNDDDWKKPHEYVDTSNLYYGEIGTIAGVRFVESTEAKIFAKAGADGADVYSTLVLGKNAYGTTKISGNGLQHIVKQLGSAGSADPLDQRASVGWKATKAVTRLNEAFMVRIETCSTFDAGAN